jgi:hypothetical protein
MDGCPHGIFARLQAVQNSLLISEVVNGPDTGDSLFHILVPWNDRFVVAMLGACDVEGIDTTINEGDTKDLMEECGGISGAASMMENDLSSVTLGLDGEFLDVQIDACGSKPEC